MFKKARILSIGLLALTMSIGGFSIARADDSNTSQVGYDITSINKDGTNQLTSKQYPDFSNADAYMNSHYGQKKLFGQCTWFASGRFYELYGYSPDFTGDGYMCVDQLLRAHPDNFYESDTAVVGSVGSSDFYHNHVWIVVGVDEDGSGITIQEGNLDGITNDWTTGCSDWQEKHYTYEELKVKFGKYTFANPYVTPVQADAEAKAKEEAEKEQQESQKKLNKAVKALEDPKQVVNNSGKDSLEITTETTKSVDEIDGSKKGATQDISKSLLAIMKNKK